jgi:hypothetical protein
MILLINININISININDNDNNNNIIIDNTGRTNLFSFLFYFPNFYKYSPIQKYIYFLLKYNTDIYIYIYK